MLDPVWRKDAVKTACTLQIIVGAMSFGVLFFLVIALVVGLQNAPLARFPAITLLCLVAFVFAASGLVARSIALRILISRGRQEIIAGSCRLVGSNQQTNSSPSDETEALAQDARHLLKLYQTKTIVSTALCEGLAFFATIAFLIEGNFLSLGLAVVLMLLPKTHFPTSSRLIGWVDKELEILTMQAMRTKLPDR